MKILISCFVVMLYVTNLTCMTFNQVANEEDIYDIFERDVNRFRKWLDARGMVKVTWSDELHNVSQRSGNMIIRSFGCNSDHYSCPMDADEEKCDDPYISLLVNYPGFYHVKLPEGTSDFSAGMSHFYSFLEQKTENCGDRYAFYNTDHHECAHNAHKIYSLTTEFGCALFECVDKKEKKIIAPLRYEIKQLSGPWLNL